MQLINSANALALLASLALAAPAAQPGDGDSPAPLATREMRPNLCTQQKYGEFTYILRSENVPKSRVSDICGGFWDNLNHFPSCVVNSARTHSCGPLEVAINPVPRDLALSGRDYELDSGGGFKCEFTVNVGCDAGSVGSAWYEATANRTNNNEQSYGEMVCG